MDRLLDDGLAEVDEMYRDSILKVAGKDLEQDNDGFRFSLPAFTRDEIKDFYKFYGGESDTIAGDEQDQRLNQISDEIFKQTNGHPVFVVNLVLGHSLAKHVTDIYSYQLKNNEDKLKTTIACGLFDMSFITITDELLQRIGALNYAHDLEGITLRHEDSPTGYVWKTFHTEWNIELLSFLFNRKKGTELELITKNFESVIKSIFDNEKEDRVYSIINSLYHIAADKRIPLDIVESVVSKQICDDHFSDNTKRDLYALVIPRAYLLLEKYEDGLQKCEEALNIDRRFAPAHLNKGGFLYKLKRYEDAIAAYEKAIEFNPKYYTAYYNKGNAHYALGRHQDAIDSYREAIKINQNYDSAWHNLGTALSRLASNAESANCYDKAIAWYQEAVDCYDKVIKTNPDQAGDARLNKGEMLYRLACIEVKQYHNDKALSHLEDAIRIDDKYAKLASDAEEFKSLQDHKRFKKIVTDRK